MALDLKPEQEKALLSLIEREIAACVRRREDAGGAAAEAKAERAAAGGDGAGAIQNMAAAAPAITAARGLERLGR